MELAVLGPLEARIEGSAVNLGGPKQRAVLAILLLHANEVVSRDRLIDGLWGERAPSTAARSLDTYVSRLRGLLGADRIERQPPGYVIRTTPGELDLERFETLLEQGRVALADGDPAAADDRLQRALAEWRGAALADLLYEPFAASEAAQLEERRVLAAELQTEARLALGRGRELVGGLERLVAEHPFRERLLEQLMVALCQAGRTSDALAAFRAGRQRFADELGLDPSPHLRELEQRILTGDLELGPPVQTRRPRRDRSRWRLAAGAFATAVVASVAGWISFTGNQASARVVELRSDPAQRDPSRLADTPAAMAADAHSVWIAQPSAGGLVRIDQRSRRIVQRIPVEGAGAVVVGGGAVWVGSVPGSSVVRIDAATGQRTQTLGLGGAEISALAFGLGRVWVADVTDRALISFDPASGGARKTFELLVRPTALSISTKERTIWIADYDAALVTEIDADTGATIATTRVGNGPAAVALGAGGVWVANSLDSTVSRIDPQTGVVVHTFAVGSYPAALAIDGTSVWVGNTYSSTVTRVDAKRNAVAGTTSLEGRPTSMVATANRILVGTETVSQHRGGTLRLVRSVPLSIDPAINVQLGPLQAAGFTSDGLLGYDLSSGAQGLGLVPDLAIAVPLPEDGGRTYTFRLRSGIRYSNGEFVRAQDFRRAFERLFRLHTPWRDSFRGIRGSSTCTQSSCDLSRGVVTDDATRTVTFHLSNPDLDFLRKLAGANPGSPVPVGTPWHAVSTAPIPGTGPYKIAHADRHEIRYVRNPYFKEWSHAAQPDGNPDEITMRFGLTPAQEVRAVERGEADWSADGIPAPLLREVTTRFASQVHVYAATDTEFLQFNTMLPPFNDVRVRRALNYAIDRQHVVRLFGGRNAAAPTCQVLPPGLVGYKPYCPYTRRPGQGPLGAPDLPAARRLVALSHTKGAKVTIWGTPDDLAVQHGVVGYVVALLRTLGYDARKHIVAGTFFNTAPPSVFDTIQMTPPGWADVSAANFFIPWFTCDSAFNHHWYCDGAAERMIALAESQAATDPRAAATTWQALDRRITRAAAWVPLVNSRQVDFLSRRVENYQRNPVLGLIADQLTVS